MLQCVYLISNGKGQYKIGVSSHPNFRLKCFETGNPEKLELAFTSPYVYNAIAIEHYIHKLFEKSRLSGEWFEFLEIDTVIQTILRCIEELGKHHEKTSMTEEKLFLFFDKALGVGSYEEQIQKLKKDTLEESIKNNNAFEFLQYLQLGLSGGVYESLIYLNLFGKPLKQLQEEYHVKPKESIREYLTAEQLKDVESMEMLVSGLINCGWGYEQIKEFLETNHLKQLAA